MRAALLLGALGVMSTGCGSSGSGNEGFAAPAPTNASAGPLPQPSVIASISSGSLGDECTSCESNMQIAFDARTSTGMKAATIEVVSVTLLESATGNLVDTLAVSNARVWNGGAYVPWDRSVKPGGDLKASYDLTAPVWSKIDGSEAGRYGSAPSYSKSFKLRVTLRVDGLEMILESTDLDRQSPAPPT